MYVCMYVCTYVCMYVCMCVYDVYTCIQHIMDVPTVDREIFVLKIFRV